ncbi:PHD finger protein 21B-like isoform X2 [Physella acuta]|uniref:PHD finger protein 21B-like isoform X2 n=1 Tax=Physella acuta TaxID=109671 RepID=UPI0027DD7DC7|nr:PHD finger protein 21B-like isoform X2 [Physella acuta]
MSRVELNTIQAKLKAAIQNHQMLVVKMKGDNQNVSLKKGLAELQEEIKRLSEEQKKIVMKLRESLVKSSPQSLPPPMVTVSQTITAIGQPRLVSFPTQGGSTILPVGMVAVPIAHMQRPAVGMAIHSAGGPLSQATNISLIPAGILSAGCNLANNTLGGILHGNITINNFGNLGNTVSSLSSSSRSNVVSTHVQSQVANGSSTPSCAGASSHTTNRTNNMAASNDSSKSSTSIVLNNLTNMANLFIATSINNASLIANPPIATSINNASLIANPPIATSINNASLIANTPIATSINNASLIANPPIATSINNASLIANTPIATSINNASVIATSNCNGHVSSSSCLPATPGLIVTHFQQQPLVQPQLLQQQQQQILQMIQQQQQQQQPQQRLASHLPIKVPQYTASLIRPVTAPAQYCNIAPAPTTQALAAPCTTKVSQALAAPCTTRVSQESPKEVMKVRQTQVGKVHDQTHTKVISSQLEKEKFLELLELYTVDALNEMLRRRNERKRRTTANPHYSFGFEMNRKERGTIKKHRGRGPSLDSWVDSTEHNTGSKKMDNHDDYCAVCNKGGQLLMCETCRFVYHLDCLNPPLTQAPKYAWSCPHCLVSGKGLAHLNSSALAKVHSYISHRTAQVDAMKTEKVKSKELSEELTMLGTQLQDLSSKLKEETETQTRLTVEENNVQQDLATLTEFIHSMKDSTAGHFV